MERKDVIPQRKFTRDLEHEPLPLIGDFGFVDVIKEMLTVSGADQD
jgi:hypothetical protein